MFKTDRFEIHSVGGGCINYTYKLTLPDKRSFFCKINSSVALPNLFTSEINGLELLARQKIIKVPVVIDLAHLGADQILVLEWIEPGKFNNNFWEIFGEQLALLHTVQNSTFGLDEDNYMGSVPQINQWRNSWIDFFREMRLEPLVAKCINMQLLTSKHQKQFENIYLKLKEVFPYEQPCLSHGDLWSGNFMCNVHAQPVLIDPAVYYGHRSVDLAMTKLFGGFDKAFYESYNYHLPFPHNYKEQWQICNLYPLLIHLFLFGSSYLPQIQRTLNQFT